MSESIVIICPDTNFRLWPTRLAEAAIGGGKSSLFRLAASWASAGCQVTIAGVNVLPGEAGGIKVVDLAGAAGQYDVAIYVTGYVGHFKDPMISGIQAHCNLLWLNGPHYIPPPPEVTIDWFIAPARFIARLAIDEWGFPAERVVTIPGEGVPRRCDLTTEELRDEFAVIYASTPLKGLGEAVTVIDKVRRDYPQLLLDVYGSTKLWGDHFEAQDRSGYPAWVRFINDLPQPQVFARMPRYGLMLYLTKWVDAFSSSTAEALANGVIVIATAHGSNAEFIRHGWNGFLVSSNQDLEPNLTQAEELLRCILANPSHYSAMRRQAVRSVPTWDEQAAQWQQIWRSPQRVSAVRAVETSYSS